MTPSGQTICLCMIVKDEAPVIARCLASARPLVDYWIIVDTGSRDGTQDIVRAAMADLPGELVERPWVDFGHNRSEALAFARPHADYSLVIDADDVFEVPAGFSMPLLDADSYVVDIKDTSIAYQRSQLFRNALPWRYAGVLHEFPACDGAHSSGHLPVVMHRNHDGRRRRDPSTYRNDAAILERALEAEEDPFLRSRYTFYLAQSWRDCGENEKSLQAYLRRAELGYWDQEVFVSLLQAGRLMESLGRNLDETLAVYARATAACPNRAEAAHAASRLCRFNKRHEQGAKEAELALGLTIPGGGLFVEPWIYHYGLCDEFAVNAYWAKRYIDSLKQTLAALATGKVPAAEHARFVTNARFAFDRMTKGEPSWPADAPIPPQSRSVHTRPLDRAPRVLVAILAKPKALTLPFFLARLAAFEYPKDRMVLYVRTTNNTDATHKILADWLAENGDLYAGIEFDDRSLPTHDWNTTRLATIRAIRNEAMAKTEQHECEFFLPIDVNNLIAPCTLSELVALNLPIVAPLVRDSRVGARYANFHAKIDQNGYFQETPRYDEILDRRITGLFELPVVHCTYLVRADVIPQLSYEDGSERLDYVIFSGSARKAGIPQYLDNRQLYGYLTLQDDQAELVAEQLKTLENGFFSHVPAIEPTPLVDVSSALSPSGTSQEPMRIVASMTTIPSRIDQIRPVIEAILRQSKPVAHIEINIPYVCRRTEEAYQIPNWLISHPGVRIYRTDDHGPITKIAPTLLRYRADQKTYIWSVDDDCAYPQNQLEVLCQAHQRDVFRVLTRYGGVLNNDGTVQFWYGQSYATMLEGFGGVLYPPNCIKDDFEQFIKRTSADRNCVKNDDIVLAMYFNHHAVPIYLYNLPSDETPYMVEGWLPHSKRDALSHAGHVENYKVIYSRVSEILRENFWVCRVILESKLA